MSRRIILMERKIEQAKKKGIDPTVLIPKNCKRNSILKLFKQKEK